jgi:hypothetical protein
MNTKQCISAILLTIISTLLIVAVGAGKTILPAPAMFVFGVVFVLFFFGSAFIIAVFLED